MFLNSCLGPNIFLKMFSHAEMTYD